MKGKVDDKERGQGRDRDDSDKFLEVKEGHFVQQTYLDRTRSRAKHQIETSGRRISSKRPPIGLKGGCKCVVSLLTENCSFKCFQTQSLELN